MKPRPLILRYPITDVMINDLQRDPLQIRAFGLYLSRRCNLRCIHCLSDAGGAKQAELSLLRRILLLDEAAELGARQLIISGAGEPLMDQHFWPIIEHAHRDLGMFVLIYSNTTLVTREIAARLAGIPRLSIIGKLYSFREQVSDAVFGGPFTALVNRGFQNLVECGMNEAEPTRLGFQCAILRVNLGEIPDILRYARLHNLFPQINTLFLSGRAQQEFGITREEYSSLYQECQTIDREEFGIEWDSCWNAYNPIIAGCCVRPKYWVMSDDVGELRACSIDYGTRIGDVKAQSLREVLQQNSEKVLSLRRMFRENDCFICNRPTPSGEFVELMAAGRDLAR